MNRGLLGCALLSGAMGAAALLSWRLDAWHIGTFGRNYVPMAPSTAWMFVLLAGATGLRFGWPARPFARAAALVATGVALVTGAVVIAQFILGTTSSWERWLSGTDATVGGIPVGRMSVLTAASFFAAAVSLALQLPRRTRRRYWPVGALAAGTAGLAFSLVTILAYATGTPLFYGLGIVPMALLTALAFAAMDGALVLGAAGGLWVGRHRSRPAISSARLSQLVWRPVTVIAALGLGIVLTGFIYLRNQQRALRNTIGNELGAIADLKVGQIASWRRERLADATFLSRAPFVARDVRELLAHPESTAAKHNVLYWLNLMKAGDRYEAVALYDDRLNLLVSAPAGGPVPDPELRADLEGALHTGKVTFGVMAGEAAGAVPHIDEFAPIFATAPGPSVNADSGQRTARRTEAVILLRLDPRRFLYPLLAAWPIPSRTAETLLVRREGGRVVYLNDLRHIRGKPLATVRSLRNESLVSAMAVHGRKGPVEGLDYRGAPVLAAFRFVPDTRWVMVAKVDQAEIFAPLRRQAILVGGIVTTLLLAAGLGVMFYWRKAQAEILLGQSGQLEALVRERTSSLEAEIRVRQRVEAQLRLRSDAERLLQEISAGLLSARPARTDTAIETALARLAVFAEVDAAYLYTFDESQSRCSLTHLWCGPLLAVRKDELRDLEASAMPWWMNRLRAGAEVVVPDVDALPPEAATERTLLAAQGIRAALDAPMVFRDRTVGFIGVASARAGHRWRSIDTTLLHALAQVMLNAQRRKSTEEELQRHRENLEELVARRTAAWEESTVRLQAASRAAHVGLWDWDLRADKVYYSSEWKRQTGVDEAEIGDGIDEWHGRIHPDDVGRVVAILQQYLRHPWPNFQFEYRFRHQDGSWRWMLAQASLLSEGDGQPQRLLGSQLDITERRRAEEALRESEALLTRAQAVAHLGSYRHDLVLDRWSNSPELDRIFGIDGHYPRTTDSWIALVAPEEREEMLRYYREDVVAQGGRFAREYQIVRYRDGERRWVAGLGELEYDEAGRPVRMIGTIQDITERKRAENALRESEARFRTLVEHAPDAVLVGTADAPGAMPRLAYANAAALKLFGAVTADEILGRPVLDRVHPDHHPGVRQHILELERQEYVGPAEQVYLRLDGTPVPVEVAAARITYQGHPGAVVFVRDIGERKRAEAKIREQTLLLEAATDAIVVCDLDRRLQYGNHGAERLYGWKAADVIGQEVSRLLGMEKAAFEAALQDVLRDGRWTGELKHRPVDGPETVVLGRWSLVRNERGEPDSILVIHTEITERKKLESQLYRAQRLESVGQLASGIAHDLNNILAPLLMVAPLLRAEITNPETLRLVDILESNAKRGADVVRQILTFSRGLKGGTDLAPVSLPPLVREVMTVIRETFPRSLRLQGSIPDDLWPVDGDATQLHQVVMNLCVNARDAMPGGGTLTLAAENLVIDELYAGMSPGAKPGPHVALSVADTGTGIAPEHLDVIFDPFFTTKEPGKGTGLGLSTVVGIVRAHGGFIKVDSVVGRGTQFHIYLPAHSGATPPVEAPAGPLPAGNGETILVVDDEEGVRLLTKRILERYGYQVLLAGEGSEAVVVYAQHSAEIAAVITDLMMPVMDGTALIRALNQIAPGVGVLATTGVTESTHVAAALRLGAREVLRKPYTPEALLKHLRDLLDQPPKPAGTSDAEPPAPGR